LHFSLSLWCESGGPSKQSIQADLFQRTFILPSTRGGRDDFAVIREERMRRRLEEINSIIKAQNFYDWLTEQKEVGSRPALGPDPLWWHSPSKSSTHYQLTFQQRHLPG
jgi:hypothetical protein